MRPSRGSATRVPSLQRSLASWVNLTVTTRGASPFSPNGFIPFPFRSSSPKWTCRLLITSHHQCPAPIPLLSHLAVAAEHDGLLPWLLWGGQGAPPPPQAVAGTIPQRPLPGKMTRSASCFVPPVVRSNFRVGSGHLIESVLCAMGSGRPAGYAEEGRFGWGGRLRRRAAPGDAARAEVRGGWLQFRS